jgi:2-dehydro-3-deoxyphosphogluconate aldolase/(4S)-4-hydroxy-2-oxoglutarate aldolase
LRVGLLCHDRIEFGEASFTIRPNSFVIEVTPMSSDLQRVLDCGIVAIIRATSGDQLVNVARALYEGGIDVIEVTFTVPNVLEILAAVRKDLGSKILLGAGTVLDPETARAALLAGAEFLVSPSLNLEVIKVCKRYSKLVMPGAFTPTEIVTAWEAGADIVKVFPADCVGPNYLKALRGPLPHVRLLPTGGVDLKTLPDFFKAGACAVGLGSQLVEKAAVESGDMNRIRDLAAQYVGLVKSVRAAH